MRGHWGLQSPYLFPTDSTTVRNHLQDTLTVQTRPMLILSSIIDDPRNSHLIRWSDKGDSFIILDRNEFARTLLPTLCGHGNFRAFCSRLWYYSFDLKKQSVNGSSPWRSWQSTPFREFNNPNFRRDDETGLSRIECRRRKTKEPSDPGSQSSLFARCSRARGESTMDEDHVASDMWRGGKACESVRGSYPRYPKRRRVA
jgi:heat shock transcription factor